MTRFIKTIPNIPETTNIILSDFIKFKVWSCLVGKGSRESSVETLRPDTSAAASPVHTLKHGVHSNVQLSPICAQGLVNSWSVNPQSTGGLTGSWEQNQIRQIFQVVNQVIF